MDSKDHNRLRLTPIVLAAGCLTGIQSWKATPVRSQGIVRDPVFAGTWYPADAKELRSTIKGYLQRARLSENGPPDADLLGTVAPDADLMSSGPEAA